MLLLIDTCFSNHVRELHVVEFIDLRIILNDFRWGYTPSVLEEIEYYDLGTFIDKDNAILLQVPPSEINDRIQEDHLFSSFDRADQELFCACRREDALLLSDDGELLMESISMNFLTRGWYL